MRMGCSCYEWESEPDSEQETSAAMAQEAHTSRHDYPCLGWTTRHRTTRRRREGVRAMVNQVSSYRGVLKQTQLEREMLIGLLACTGDPGKDDTRAVWDGSDGDVDADSDTDSDTDGDTDSDTDADVGLDATGRWLGDCADEDFVYAYHVDMDLIDDQGSITGTVNTDQFYTDTNSSTTGTAYTIYGTRTGDQLELAVDYSTGGTIPGHFSLTLAGDLLDGELELSDAVVPCSLLR